MSEYWKSTPKYWCKFCESYVRDTGLERKNHESSAKHQGNIQRSLSKLHKDQAHQQRDAQKAKDEVARLNGLVGTKTSKAPVTKAQPPPAFKSNEPRRRLDLGQVDYAAHRKAQAQQLLAMGMELPEQLKEAVAGTGSWQTVSRTIVESAHDSEAGSGGSIDVSNPEMRVKGVHKRKAEDDESEAIAAGSHKRKAWGSSFKSYPGRATVQDDTDDLDALLDGVSKKQTTVVVPQLPDVEDEPTAVKQEQTGALAAADFELKHEDSETAVTAPPVVAFKKRKGKR